MVTGHVPLGTKCCLPRLSPLLVQRSRLHHLLDEDTRCPITLVCGPPGAGKTTLLASRWSAPSPAERVAWLCLDPRDNDPDRLGVLLAATLSPEADPDLSTPSRLSAHDALDLVFEQLVGRHERGVLVLDDVDSLRAPEALEVLSHLVRRAPEQLDVVLASRADPPIGLDALRLDGRLGEIRVGELAFTAEEAAELLAAHDVELDADDLQLLWRRTQGWAAGLRLAASALQVGRDPGRFVRSTARTQAVLSDYLLRELLVCQEESAQWFLLRTSVADYLTPELAQQLSDDPAAATLLDDFERRGILVVDRYDATLYRYHGLFGELLRARLERHDPELARQLHATVARWCLEHDQPQEAQHHLQAAEDWETLGRLLVWRWLDATLAGHQPELLTGLDHTVLYRSPGLALAAAADACRRLNREEAEVHRDVLDRLLSQPDVASPTDGESFDRARLVLDVVFGHAFGHDDRTRRAAALLEETPSDDTTSFELRRLGGLRWAQAMLELGDWGAATKRFGELAAEQDGGWIAGESTAYLALLDAARGRIESATSHAGRVLDDPACSGSSPACLAARLATAVCAVQQGELRNATATISDDSPSLDELGAHQLRLLGRAVQAGLARRSVHSVFLDDATAAHPLARLTLAALGVLEVADANGRSVQVGSDGEQAVNLARRRVAAGDLVSGAKDATDWIESDANALHPRTFVEALILGAIGAEARGEHGLALRHLGDALDLAELRGIVAPMFDHRAAVIALLDRHLSDLASQRTLAVALLDRLRPASESALVEPLTDREIEVLAHLPTLMSNAEIAEGLHLSINTVKSHLKALYRKLGVEGRRQAVVRGRELELI